MARYKNLAIVVAAIVLGLGAYIIANGQRNAEDTDREGDIFEMVMPFEDGDSGFLENFNTLDIEGNEVGSDIFADYKITMVDVWGTYCNPCIAAMPTIQKLYEEYKDKGMNVIGILCDAQNDDGSPNRDKILLARDIKNNCGAGFKSLLISDNIYYVIQDVTAIPTTFFVDSNGKIISEMYVGGNSFERWSEIINEIL